jgi:hypothetical protein
MPETEEQTMWWNGLPVLTPGGDEALADREVALACAARFRPIDPSQGGSATTKTENEAAAFTEWLAKAGDSSQRRIRRLALCMACENPSGTRSDILQTAEYLRQELTDQ